jgi:hypothetical protein
MDESSDATTICDTSTGGSTQDALSTHSERCSFCRSSRDGRCCTEGHELWLKSKAAVR